MQWSGHLIHFLLNPQRRLAPLRQGHTSSLPLNFRRRRLSQPPQKKPPRRIPNHWTWKPPRPSVFDHLPALIQFPCHLHSPLSPPPPPSSSLETPLRRNVIGGGCCCFCFLFPPPPILFLLPLSSHLYSTLLPLSYLNPPKTNPQKQLPPSPTQNKTQKPSAGLPS